ncbi:MAG: ABC transporter permease subunit [Nannocystaceae bacterium]
MLPRDIWIIARFEVWRHLSSRHGVLGLVLLVLASGVLGYQIGGYTEEVDALVDQAHPALVVGGGMLQSMTELPLDRLLEVLDAHPPMLVMLFAGLLSMVPIATYVFAFDQTASEIETRHARFLLFRSERDAIYLGKALGAYLMVAGALTIATALLAAFILARSATFAPVTDTLYVGRAWLTCLATAIPYVAFLGLVGAVVGKSRRVLSVAVFFWIGLGIVGGAISHWRPELDVTPYLFPSVARFHLLTDSFSMALPTLVHLVLFSVACVGLGLWRFRRRDL